ncbi:MAG: hypothetical protein WCH37_03980, partial [Synechococcaceae cyanobacterium ELA182]
MSDASDRQPCQRCSGSGVYGNYGSCYRCSGSGMVSMAQIAAYFRAQAPVSAPVTVKLEKSKAIAAAKATAADLKAAGFKGRI